MKAGGVNGANRQLHIERFGFTNPVLISDDGEIIAGHGRVEAARLLGWKTVPTLALSHLSETERRAYVIADNKLAINAGWDKESGASRSRPGEGLPLPRPPLRVAV